MILTDFNSSIPIEDLKIAYKVISEMMESKENCLSVDNGFIRVRNYLANCLVMKMIKEDEN